MRVSPKGFLKHIQPKNKQVLGVGSQKIIASFHFYRFWRQENWYFPAGKCLISHWYLQIFLENKSACLLRLQFSPASYLEPVNFYILMVLFITLPSWLQMTRWSHMPKNAWCVSMRAMENLIKWGNALGAKIREGVNFLRWLVVPQKISSSSFRKIYFWKLLNYYHHI